MKIIRTFFLTLLCLALSACIAGIETTPLPPPPAPTVAPATQGAVNVSLQAVPGGRCMNPGDAWNVVLPDCTWTNVDNLADRGYSLEFLNGAINWLAFNNATREVSLNGVTVVPRYTDAINVRYTCFYVPDPTISASTDFTMNNCDGSAGRVLDGDENSLSEPPLVNNTIGLISLTDLSMDIYRPPDRTPSALPLETTGMLVMEDDDAADLDGDGIPNNIEIYTLNTSIFLRNTTASLTATTAGNFDVGHAIGYGDFNNDTFNDVVVGTFGGRLVMRLWNNAIGAFDPWTLTDVDPNPLNGLVVADFNADGNMDVAVFADSADLNILYGDGTGALNFQYITEVLTDPRALTRGDFNADGFVDLALLHEFQIFIYLYNPANDFFDRVDTENAGGDPHDIATADFNGDNILDIAAIDDNLDQLRIYFGQGNGQFTFSNTYNLVAGHNPRNITLADFNMDGNIDAAISQDLKTIAIFAGNGDGTFAAVSESDVSSPMGFLTAADMNGDNAPDLVMFDTVFDFMMVGLNTFKATGTVVFSENNYVLNAQGYEAVVYDINQKNTLGIVATDTSALNLIYIYMQ